MAKDKGGGNNLTRQHYQLATGANVTGMKSGGKVPSQFAKGAKVAPKRGRG